MHNLPEKHHIVTHGELLCKPTNSTKNALHCFQCYIAFQCSTAQCIILLHYIVRLVQQYCNNIATIATILQQYCNTMQWCISNNSSSLHSADSPFYKVEMQSIWKCCFDVVATQGTPSDCHFYCIHCEDPLTASFTHLAFILMRVALAMQQFIC